MYAMVYCLKCSGCNATYYSETNAILRQSSPFDTGDSTRTRCHTGKISYECDLLHRQDKTFLKFQETKLFTSNLSLIIFKKIFAAMAFYLYIFFCLFTTSIQFNECVLQNTILTKSINLPLHRSNE